MADLRICDTTRALLCSSFGRTSSSSPVVCVFCAALLLPLPFDVFFEGCFSRFWLRSRFFSGS